MVENDARVDWSTSPVVCRMVSIPKIDVPVARLLAVTLVSLVPIVCDAQQSVVAKGGSAAADAQPGYEGVFLPSDRSKSRGIATAAERIAAGEYSQAIRFLDEVLAAEEDAFVGRAAGQELIGLKLRALQMIGALQPAGREAYQTTFGPEAQRSLKEALAAGDLDRLRRVANRFFFTPAGYEATLLLAQIQADRGQHFAAARSYQQLLDAPDATARFDPQLSVLAAVNWLAAGRSDRAQELVESLLIRNFRSVQIAGENHQLKAARDNPIAWLRDTVGAAATSASTPEQQWLTHGGNPSRNGQVEGGLPHMRVRWQVRLLAHPRLIAVYDNLAAEFSRRKTIAPVAGTPLAVGDTILIRSAHNLVAVDFVTGKLVWQTQPQSVSEFDRLINAGSGGREDLSDAEPTQSFARRVWEDRLYNQISSDGQRVFVIRDLAAPGARARDVWAAVPFASKEVTPQTNRLCAYDLATEGKLVWEIDGANSSGGLSGAFFLGAPLALGHSLFALAEIKGEGEVYLVAIDSRSGEMKWQQQLAMLEAGILFDSTRRLQASMPSYEAGILVCPTGAGAVVGIDLAKRSLAWAYRYPNKNDAEFPLGMRRRSRQNANPQRGWIDSSVRIAEGRVLLTPPESDSLHCLDLQTGELLWKIDREKAIYLATVDQDRALLVGKEDLRAVSLIDGQSVWPRPKLALPPGSIPTGQGFFSRGRYYLPLSSAEVIAVELQSGEIVARSKARAGQVLGNLICHRGTVISQNGRNLDRFDQVEVLRRQSQQQLANSPHDVDALRTLGEIVYNEGDLSKAIEYFQTAYQTDASDLRTREVLSECLAEALDDDFSTFRQRLPLLRQLQQQPGREQLTLMRIEAKGLLEAGELLESFAVCLQMFAAAEQSSQLLEIGQQRQVRVARWIRAQVDTIWQQAASDQRLTIETQLRQLFEDRTAWDADQSTALMVDSFGSLPLAAPWWMDRARQLTQQGQLLAAQQILLRLGEQSDPQLRSEAVARIAQLLHHSGQHRAALRYDDQLAGPLAEVVCLDGKTGAECLEQWRSVGSDPLVEWPYGKVEVAEVTHEANSGNRVARDQWLGVPLERTDSILGTSNLFFSNRGGNGKVLLRDSHGRETYQAVLSSQSRYQPQYHPSTSYCISRGNLLLMSLGRQLVAFDTLAASENAPPTVLWRTNVISNLGSANPNAAPVRRSAATRFGSHRALRAELDGQWVGVLGPLSHESFVYQNQRSLVCVDVLTDTVQWTRDDVPTGCDLYGDQHYVFAVPRGSKEAFVFSTLDGRSLGKVAVPAWNEQLSTLGRKVIRWRSLIDGRRELVASDAFSGEVLWKHHFNKLTRIDVAQGRFVGLFEPAGRCVIVDAADGRIVVDQSTQADPLVNEIHLLAGSDNFVFVRNHPASVKLRSPTGRGTGATATQFVNIQGLTGRDYAVIRGQISLYNRQTGAPLWQRPAEVDQKPLMLTQPVDLPLLAFVGITTRRRDQRGGGGAISMLVLEKATGRLLYQNDDLPPSGRSKCVVRVADPQQHTVAIEMAGKAINLKFTAMPRPPEPPVTYEAGAESERGSKGLQAIVEKLFNG